MKGVFKQAAIYGLLIGALSACATTPPLNEGTQSTVSQSTKNQTVRGITKTGADARLETLSREELAKKIPAPKPLKPPTG